MSSTNHLSVAWPADIITTVAKYLEKPDVLSLLECFLNPSNFKTYLKSIGVTVVSNERFTMIQHINNSLYHADHVVFRSALPYYENEHKLNFWKYMLQIAWNPKSSCSFCPEMGPSVSSLGHCTLCRKKCIQDLRRVFICKKCCRGTALIKQKRINTEYRMRQDLYLKKLHCGTITQGKAEVIVYLRKDIQAIRNSPPRDNKTVDYYFPKKRKYEDE